MLIADESELWLFCVFTELDGTKFQLMRSSRWSTEHCSLSV